MAFFSWFQRMKARLSDQADIIADGQVPMPMYTCLHVKSSVSAKVFQEWYEFTPYEVGIPKYGLFFKTSDFASKFYMGEKIKSFPEVRLHYLYGIWGSAFTILFKRFVQEKNRQNEINKMVFQTPSNNDIISNNAADDDDHEIIVEDRGDDICVHDAHDTSDEVVIEGNSDNEDDNDEIFEKESCDNNKSKTKFIQLKRSRTQSENVDIVPNNDEDEDSSAQDDNYEDTNTMKERKESIFKRLNDLPNRFRLQKKSKGSAPIPMSQTLPNLSETMKKSSR